MVRSVVLAPRQVRSSPSPATLGFASHLLAGLLPFISSGAITRLGLTRATAALYLAGSAILTVTLAVPRLRRSFIAETARLLAADSRRLFVGGLAGFLVAGIAYYVGLANTPRVAEYIFLTRLDWLVQAAVAVVWLREPWTPRGLLGGAFALTGGLALAWTGAFGVSGLVAALVYILASLVGYSSFKPLSGSAGPAGALTLTVWRHWINTAGFVTLFLVSPGTSLVIDGTGLFLAATAGTLIVILFALRFTALTDLPLWVLSAQAPTQALVAIAATLATTGVLSGLTLAGMALIVLGELMVVRESEAAEC